MDELAIVRRKIQLKRQALAVLKAEIVELRIREALLYYLERLQTQTEANGDRLLSQKHDCLTFLLENFKNEF